jgi:hypothetical protein
MRGAVTTKSFEDHLRVGRAYPDGRGGEKRFITQPMGMVSVRV